jgi:hypothetical protein
VAIFENKLSLLFFKYECEPMVKCMDRVTLGLDLEGKTHIRTLFYNAFIKYSDS